MKKTIEFPTFDGLYILRGTAYLPDGATGPVPAIIASSGLGDSAERLEPVAEAFAQQGFGVLTYDHRNCGISDGMPRLEIDPIAQARDMKMAITFAQSFEHFESKRLGLWGTSFSGSHVLAVAAYDKRIKAVVSQVPWISGVEVVLRTGGLPLMEAFQQVIDSEWSKVLAGEPSPTVVLGRTKDDPSTEFSLFRDDDAMNYFANGPMGTPASWVNGLTLRSLAYFLDHDILAHAKRISPTPLMMILASEDKTMPVEPAYDFFQAALEPKEVVAIPGGHYDIYMPDRTFTQATEAAVRWFKSHL
ncbi:alpha/beta hydrolase [Granulicella sibirica]|nr:alpha/beta fold hydrolase [Granulicella sibirica]